MHNRRHVSLIHVGTDGIQTISLTTCQNTGKSFVIIVSSLLLRISALTGLSNKTLNAATSLKQQLCRDGGVLFTKAKNDFRGSPYLFCDDGLHLNNVASAQLERLLNKAVVSFPKNFKKLQVRVGQPVLKMQHKKSISSIAPNW